VERNTGPLQKNERFRLRPWYKKENSMPVKVVRKSGVRPWKIVEVATGKVVGSSTSKADAEASARARNAAYVKKTGK
jgi:hypothetical protein